MRRPRAASFGSALLALSLLAPLPAAAQSSAAEKAAAEALFDQGKKLMAEGKFADACPKFAESQRLDAGIGTMLYLSDCYEKLGRTASAWASFRDAESAARASGQGERARIARDRAAALEPKLSRLTVNVSPKTADLAGVTVKRDGTPLSNALWGSPLPVDPGPHSVEASAPGYRKATLNVEVRPGGGTITADVPALEKDLGASALPPPTTTPPPPGQVADAGASPWPLQKTLALVAGGVGVVGLGVGALFGLQARSNWNKSQSDGRCTNGSCNDEGYELATDAKNQAGIATVGFGVGVLGLAGGAVLWLTAPKPAPASGASGKGWQLAPVVGAGTLGAQLGGRW
ncbi:MAG TPA: hypothetical protein VFS43_26765 [Polyangiaceae bacterium]|nr:hypothetical protein [Polyangiaceae bacterium]